MAQEQSTDPDTTVRVKESTHRKLKQIKPTDISFDQFINSLLNQIESADHTVVFERAES
jgi:hypothetical protein